MVYLNKVCYQTVLKVAQACSIVANFRPMIFHQWGLISIIFWESNWEPLDFDFVNLMPVLKSCRSPVPVYHLQPASNQLSRSAEAYVDLKAQNLPLQFYTSTLNGLADLFEDELIPTPIPMKVRFFSVPSDQVRTYFKNGSLFMAQDRKCLL